MWTAPTSYRRTTSCASCAPRTDAPRAPAGAHRRHTLVLAQLLNGLAGASSLFLVAAGLSLIFGVTRIVNFAHGSFYMLGIYGAYSLAGMMGGGAWFWPALLVSALAVGAFGALVEVVLLRR